MRCITKQRLIIMRLIPKLIFITLIYPLSTLVYASDDAPSLSLPLACTIGVDCFIQNYVDADASQNYSDYRCGFLSYNEHRGTDFRPKASNALTAEIPVLAAADGVVRAIRDGMEDISVRVVGRESLQGKDAGNSVVIVHSNGWESQYAHLKKGSIAVQEGQKIARGTVLGLVGLSGNTEFVHLHFEIRQHGKAIDPFLGISGYEKCALGKQPLWTADTLNKTAYIPTEVLSAGFTDHPLASDEVPAESAKLPTNSPALVFWLTLFGAQTNDEQVIDFIAPDGEVLLHKSSVIDHNQAQYRSFIGKKRADKLWATGNYQVHYQLLRKQKTLLKKEFSLLVVQ
jgi:hypothetical protein